jgi:hypothetical protein
MTQGQIAQAMKAGQRLYACVWFHPAYTPNVEMNTLDFFSNDNGYDDDALKEIASQELGDGYNGDHPIYPNHLVTRVF